MLHLYNTLTRKTEPFTPIAPPRVTLYSCGPTVWNYAHIGNFRTFLFVDLLRGWLEASGYEVYHIMNLTDVDDRIIREAAGKGITVDQLVSPFITAFFEDRDYLRLEPAHDYPRATEFIQPMIRLVEGLLQNGTAYKGDDGSVYYSIARFPAYGRLSQLDRRELKSGASGRVSSDEYSKENAQDFVLWKAARSEDEAAKAAWDAPFGRGRPGWHLECSAMALELIGRRYGAKILDIHTGGVDLVFPHHEDEIAQSCAFTGESEFARVWMHAEFLNVRGTKMSKRFGNITTARDLRQDGVDAGAIRLLVYQTHYRQKLDLTDEAMRATRPWRPHGKALAGWAPLPCDWSGPGCLVGRGPWNSTRLGNGWSGILPRPWMTTSTRLGRWLPSSSLCRPGIACWMRAKCRGKRLYGPGEKPTMCSPPPP